MNEQMKEAIAQIRRDADGKTWEQVEQDREEAAVEMLVNDPVLVVKVCLEQVEHLARLVAELNARICRMDSTLRAHQHIGEKVVVPMPFDEPGISLRAMQPNGRAPSWVDAVERITVGK